MASLPSLENATLVMSSGSSVQTWGIFVSLLIWEVTRLKTYVHTLLWDLRRWGLVSLRSLSHTRERGDIRSTAGACSRGIPTGRSGRLWGGRRCSLRSQGAEGAGGERPAKARGDQQRQTWKAQRHSDRETCHSLTVLSMLLLNRKLFCEEFSPSAREPRSAVVGAHLAPAEIKDIRLVPSPLLNRVTAKDGHRRDGHALLPRLLLRLGGLARRRGLGRLRR